MNQFRIAISDLFLSVFVCVFVFVYVRSCFACVFMLRMTISLSPSPSSFVYTISPPPGLSHLLSQGECLTSDHSKLL